jgi:leucyl aminopeptidase
MTARMEVSAIGAAPIAVAADLLALPLPASSGPIPETVKALGTPLVEVARSLIEAGEARLGAVTILHSPPAGSSAARVALVGVGDPGELDQDAVRTALAATVRSARGLCRYVTWALDDGLPLSAADQAHAAVEGAVIGAYDRGHWKTRPARAPVARLELCGSGEAVGHVAARAEVLARWTNHARWMVDSPPNEMTPSRLGDACRALLAGLPVDVNELDTGEIERLGMGALAAVSRGSGSPARVLVLRYRPDRPDTSETLGIVGKAVTFDSGGYFLKPQSDITKQKADMAGGAAVACAVGAIAELRIPLGVLAVIPACENMLDGSSYRPGDILTTAAGLTVEVTNPDAEGRLILADALWYARRQGTTRIVDVATLTGAMRAGMGDMYAGVFANDDEWQRQIVAAGTASGDHAWPWPLHARYRSLLDSPLADLRNTAGRSFGYPIIAATFLRQFAGDQPWAHVDMHSTGFLDEPRDYLTPGASGYGVRLLTALAASAAG